MFTQNPGLTDIQFHLKPFWSEKAYDLLYKKGRFVSKAIALFLGFLKRNLHVFQARKYDYVLIHREAAPIGPPVFEWLLTNVFRKKIIFDFDDAIWLSNTTEANKPAAGLKWHSKFYTICSWSYRIAAGNEFLANTAAAVCKEVRVIPTIVDTENVHNPRKEQTTDHPLTIGWTGSHSTLPFIKPVLPILERLKKTMNFRFLIISNQEPDFSFPGMAFRLWNKETEARDLMDFDIGIMPLPVNDWSRGKCGFKIIQYLSMEIPAVATNLAPNDKIIQNGVSGYLCSNDEEWEVAIKELLQSPATRKTFGKAGREHIVTNYSLHSQLQVFRSLFS